jgi:SM-20-related protein
MSAYPEPVIIVDNFIGRARAEQLVQFAVAHEPDFLPATVAVGHGAIIDESHRVLRVNHDIGPMMPLIEPAIRKAVDETTPRLGLVNVDSYLLEPELSWCGNGGFFKMHADTLYRDRLANPRVMTVVYYFYKEPKAFTGGQLCLYRLGADATDSPQEKVEPRFDRAVFFASWLPHEVLPVHSSSDIFADGRFTITCWVRRTSGRS